MSTNWTSNWAVSFLPRCNIRIGCMKQTPLFIFFNYFLQMSRFCLSVAKHLLAPTVSPNPHTKQVTIRQTTRWRSNIDTYYQPLDITVYPCYYTVLVNHQWALLTFFILFHADFFATCVRRFWWRFRMLGEHEEKKKKIEATIAFSNSVWTHHSNNFP